MDTAEMIVLVSGVVLIGLVLVYFFGPRRPARASEVAGAQEIGITVRGGYQPDTIRVRAGAPVRLNFYRDDASACSEQVVIPDFGIARRLAQGETTAVEFTPEKPGRHSFTCGMGMLRGSIEVE